MLTTRLGLVASAFMGICACLALVLCGDTEDGFIMYMSRVNKIPIGNVTLIILGSSETIYRLGGLSQGKGGGRIDVDGKDLCPYHTDLKVPAAVAGTSIWEISVHSEEVTHWRSEITATRNGKRS